MRVEIERPREGRRTVREVGRAAERHDVARLRVIEPDGERPFETPEESLLGRRDARDAGHLDRPIVFGRKPHGQLPARRLAERVSRFGWHVQFLLDIESFPDLDRTLSGFPTEVVIDHMGRPDPAAGIDAPGFRSLLRFLEGGRGWAKLSAPYRTSRTGYPYADIAPFAQALVRAAPERLLWGTDWPHVMLDPPVPNTGDLAALLPNWVPEAATRKRILVDNPARLYGF